MKRKADMGLALLIVLAFFAAYLLWRPTAEPEPAAVHSEPPRADSALQAADPAPTGPDPAADPEHRPAEPSRPATKARPARLPQRTALEQFETIEAEINALPAAELQPFVRQRIDAALTGQLFAAVEATSAREKCSSMPNDPHYLERAIHNRTQRAQAMLERGETITKRPGDSPSQIFPTEQENRAHLQRWQKACLELGRMFEADYRARVEALARNGDVVSRFLYALWPPPLERGMKHFLEFQEWAARARQFSMANLEAGEAAGMLAFANMMHTSDSFLPPRIVFGRDRLSFLLAAADCGLKDDRTQSLIELLVDLSVPDGELSDEYLHDLAAILDFAEELKTLCR